MLKAFTELYLSFIVHLVFLIFVLLDFLLELIGGVLFALQAYTSELEYLVHQLEQENARLLKEEVRF